MIHAFLAAVPHVHSSRKNIQEKSKGLSDSADINGNNDDVIDVIDLEEEEENDSSLIEMENMSDSHEVSEKGHDCKRKTDISREVVVCMCL